MQCIFCSETFLVKRNITNNANKYNIVKLKEHLLVEHRFIISDISEIANLDAYFNYWRDIYQTKGSLKSYCAVTFKNKNIEERKIEKYSLLCPDLVPMDKDIRQRLINSVPQREIVPLKEMVIAGPRKNFKKQTLSPLKNDGDDDFTEVKAVAPPVRNKNERKMLNGYSCSECLDYYGTLDLTAEQLKDRLDRCSRHRATYSPPKTPPHFWDINIPSTPECKENGWLKTNS